MLWAADLRNGHALANIKVSLLVGLRLVDERSDANGLVTWHGAGRPAFALAEDGAGRAFVSLLPQPPIPPAIVGLRVESAAAVAGQRVRFVGFARKRGPNGYRIASGDVHVTLFGHGSTLATAFVHLDAAGAFEGDIGIPAGVDAGDYAMLASAAGGGVGGTSIHVDASSDVALGIRSTCPCDADANVPFFVIARRGDAPAPGINVRVQIVRTPHVVPPGGVDDEARFGTTVVYDRTVQTDAEGRAHVTIPTPSDGLDSTYGIRATTHGATAGTRIVVPNGKFSLAVEPEQTSLDVGEAAAFDIRGFDPSDGSPVANAAVKVRLSHGPAVQEENVTLDARGLAHVIFHSTNLGTNLAEAEAFDGARHVLDVASVVVEPSALSGQVASGSSGVDVAVDKTRYHSGDRAVVHASDPARAASRS